MSTELIIVSRAVQLANAIRDGMVIDRAETRKLLRQLEKLGSPILGCEIMQAQIRAVLDRRDWLTISIALDPATVRETGVHIGIVTAKNEPVKTRLSPLQKWQRKNGLDRRRS